MKLKNGIVLKSVGNENLLVSLNSGSDFYGFLRNNPTADYICQLLIEEISCDEIVEKLVIKYDAPVDEIKNDVLEFLNLLQSMGFIE